jgi:hypothetical protein
MNSHCRSWNPKWIFKSSEHDWSGQNPSAQRITYIIEKLLKLKCLKWAPIAHLDIWNTSYDEQKGWESNLQFDSQPLKVRNRPNFLVCRKRGTYHWKDFDKGYNFSSDFILIGGLHMKLCTPKVVGVLALGISGLPLRSPETKSHLDVAPVNRRKVYYKGEGGGFPQVRAVVSLVSRRLPVTCLSTKSAPTMH